MNHNADGTMIQTSTLQSSGSCMTYEQAMGRIAYLESVVASQGKTIIELRRRETPMSSSGYEWLTNLQYKAKNLGERVAMFESGEIYLTLKSDHRLQLAAKDREIRKLKNEIASANTALVTMRDNWMQAFEDLEKEHAKEMANKDCELEKVKERALKAERRLDEAKGKMLEKTRELYDVQTQLEEEKGKNLKLTAQINRDYENSSIPSSMSPNRKKIVNNREKSGKKPGAQIGHEHHPRKMHTPTDVINIPVPEKFMDPAVYELTGRVIEKQLIEVQLNLIVKHYSTPELRHKLTGTRVSAEFPGGLVDDVTYGGSVKALALLLVNHCNVSIGKVSDIICDLTGGGLKLSAGFINKLPKELSLKTEAERKKANADLMVTPVMNVDNTTAKVNGENKSVLICAAPSAVLYLARERKGHECIIGSPIEDYLHILVHDHDKTFYRYGGLHQECLDHILRYLKGSMLNEKHLKWNILMRDLIREMIHFRKHLPPDDERDPDKLAHEKVKELEAKYDEILEIARVEYEYVPPSKFYMDGFNLYARMAKYKSEHLLFLHDRRVPYTNALAERLLRIYKRKQHQVMCFRSFEGLEMLCDTLGVLATLRSQEKNLFTSVTEMFDRSIKKAA